MQDDHYNFNTEEVEPIEKINNYDFNEIESAILSSSVQYIPKVILLIPDGRAISVMSYDIRRFIRFLFPRMNFFNDNRFFD